ncbi:tetratricopeptide repeat protein [Streptomyces sp. CA-249302]|uniref:tetratricopeptide repeat protein n=1 Tax=Streptomyces sp. CA-249302 TaxID=3240058 RepID=UPI003D914225
MVDGDHVNLSHGEFHGNVVGKEVHIHAAPSPTALSALPAAPAVFTGRAAEVAELSRALDPDIGDGSESVVISAVAGLGGVGKTALALHVAHKARGKGWFPGGALFVDLRGYDKVPVTAEQAVSSLLQALGVADADLPPTPEEQYGRYRAELSSREPVLIVLDNACDPAQIAPLLPGEGAGHRVLVTSRDVQDSLPVRQFRVDALTPEASRELIDRSLRRNDPDDDRVSKERAAIDRLTELCGRLPLALLIASALLRKRRRRQASTLTAELQGATDRVLALHLERGVDQYGKQLSLRPVFDLSYARLEPELARVFRLLGLAPGDDIGAGPAAELTELPPEHLEPLLDELVAASLLTALPGGDRWRMHDLVREFARAVVAEEPELRDEADKARIRLLGHYFVRTFNATALFPQPSANAPDDYFDDPARAESWLDSEITGLVAAAQWTDTENDVLAWTAMLLGLHLDGYLRHRRAFRVMATVSAVACHAAHRLGYAEGEAQAYNAHGNALRGLWRYEEGAEAFRQALALYEQLGDLDGQAMTWNNLGLTLRALDRYDDAIDAYGKSARLYAELGGQARANVVRGNLGLALEGSGRLDEAHAVLQAALARHLESGDRNGEARVQASFGVLYGSLGRHTESLDAIMRSLALYEELGDWYSRAQALPLLGFALSDLKAHEEALAAHTYARDWFRRFNDGHKEATAWDCMGAELMLLRRIPEAMSAAQRALQLYEACEDLDSAARLRNYIDTVHELLRIAQA